MAKTEMIPIHVSISEIKSFNYLQGGQFIDEETGLREYSRLLPIFNKPEIRDLFITLGEHINQHKALPKEATRITHELEHTNNIDQYYEEIPSDHEPEIKQLEAMGRGKDKKIVMMPVPIVNFMDAIHGKVKINPKDHLQEFDFMDELFRVGATVTGAFFGGPAGAAAGNFIGKVATGANPRDNILPAAKVGLATWGAGKLAGMAGNAFPGLAKAAPGVFGSGAGWATNPAWLSSMMPNMGGAAQGASAGAQGAASAGMPGAAGGAGGLGDMFGGMGNSILPMAMMGGGMYLNQKAQKDQAKMYREMEDERRKESEALRKRYGLDIPLGVEFKKFPHQTSEIMEGKTERFKKGGHVPKGRPIVGKGKGQEDLIKDDRVKEGGWIWDATTVSHTGDGSTNAGQKEIQKLEKFLVKKVPDIKRFKKLDHGGQPRIVPCALSDGERYTPPEIVTAAGEGSNTKGAAKFRAVTKFLRRHKISKGTELPPPAPDIIKLLKKVS